MMNVHHASSRRSFLKLLGISVFVSVAGKGLTSCSNNQKTSSSSEATQAPDAVTFVTSWYAQAEHGGYYQAVATDIYKKYGLDVTIQMGGPQVNNTQLLMGGVADFVMGTDAVGTLKAVEEGIPKIAVAAIFQKSPRVIIAHPTVTSLGELKGKPVFVAATAEQTFWPFLKAQYDFTDDQKRPYNFSVAPFVADKSSAQQAYISSEPLKVEKEGGFEPEIFLLADLGYNPYANLIETKKELVDSNPDLVQRFVTATVEGYQSYLENPEPGNRLIKRDNPEMTDEQLAFGLKTIKEYGLIRSGAAKEEGIGAMTEERWRSFSEEMIDYGILKPATDYRQAYTIEFI